MAKMTCSLVVRFRLPWWWRLYLAACLAFHRAGLVHVDPDIAARFIMKNARVETEVR